MTTSALTAADEAFAARLIRRKRLFLALAIAGVTIGVTLAGVYAVWRWRDPSFPVGARAVVVVLVLLNARQNLRQYRFASILERLRQDRGSGT